MRKVRIACECISLPQDDLWLEVMIDEKGYICYPKDSDDNFGRGNVNYSGDARRYSFGIYWLDDGVAGTDWDDKNDRACELDILDRRLVVGETFKYIQAGEPWEYKIAAISAVA